jgi:S1-C subfamily serine protease
VDYAYLGVSTQELYPQLAERLGVDSHDGALVASVEAGGPADDAGLEAGDDKIDFAGQKDLPSGGDVIVGVGGTRIHDPSDLTSLVALQDPGEEVTLQVVRGKRRRDVTVTLGERPERPSGESQP